MLTSMIHKQGKVGFTDIYHMPVQKQGLLGLLYILMVGTPQLGVYSNGIYLKRALRNFRPRRILDAGCGDGTFTFYMAKHFPDAQILGVDIGEQGLHTSESTLDICNRIQGTLKFPNLNFRKLDLLELDEADAFDFVFSFDVLEHIAENRRVIHNIYRALQPGGLFLMRIPNKVQKRILNPKYTAEFEKWADIEHLGQNYEMDSLISDCREIGFNILMSRYTNGFWGKLAFESSQAIQYYKVPEFVYFGIIPILKIMRNIDTKSKLNDGDGLLLLMQKPLPAIPS